ncbi:hypothetical protein PMAYCL1PPCAC_26000, partial [Pristionchus mayeri]
MFFGESAEKGKDEVEVKDVVYEEFLDLLNIIYPGYSSISAATYPHIMKLTDRFRMKDPLRKCHLFLQKNNDINEDTKLFLSTLFNI